MWYKAEFENDEFEMILADSDEDALEQGFNLEEERNDTLLGLFLVNDEYENIKTIL